MEKQNQITEFVDYLKKAGLSQNTISTYTASVRLFFSLYRDLNVENLQSYKKYLLEHFKPNTVNIRIHGMNQYIVFKGHESRLRLSSYKLPSVRRQQRPFLDNVITRKNYEKLKRGLKKDNNMLWYFVVRFLGATGARVSELLQIKAEHVRMGWIDLYSKGGKQRRIYFPENLCKECLLWLDSQGCTSGFIFTNRQGKTITSRGIRSQLKILAQRYRVPEQTVYPHSFRHMFAKSFLGKFNDISLLADLMGHESIETTRIYLTRSSEEQRKLIDRVVIW